MQNDKVTLQDISVFGHHDQCLFDLINHTRTHIGENQLRYQMHHPPSTIEELIDLQDVIRFLHQENLQLPSELTNGTVVMIEKFFEEADSGPPDRVGFGVSVLLQKIFNRQQYFITQFSLSHIADFFKACRQLCEWLKGYSLPTLLKKLLEEMRHEMDQDISDEILAVNHTTSYPVAARLSYRVRREMKFSIQKLLALFARIDAWFSLANVTKNLGWHFPHLRPSLPTVFKASSFYHPLLPEAVAYDIDLKEGHNFLILTGANMSGKTTFLRALGLVAFMAHIGMGVPAVSCEMSFLQGIITNMHVEDNLVKGESYFLAEVLRMKQTAEKITQPFPHLVMMDELFKGTNVHDAYECTRAVIEGLLLHPHHLMILSTHLHEVAHSFEDEPGLRFAYFLTNLSDDGQYHFQYKLSDGISKDRIGYRILKNEGVLDLLKRK